MWKLEEKPGQNKPAKILYTVGNARANTTNPRTWNTFEACVKATESNLFDGIGFVFSYYDDYVGYDLDNVRDPETGQMDQEIAQEIKSLDSYTEISQSGKGLHVIFKGKKPGDRCRSGFREMYDKDRFFVMTGNHLEGTPQTINKAPPEAVRATYDKIDSSRDSTHETENKNHRYVSTSQKLTDTEVISLCMGARNADKFETLWDGNASAYRNDSSRADQALCDILAFYTQDPGQIDRLFRQSKLYRDKWEREDYRDRTIKKAIDGLSETYTPPREEEKPPERSVAEDEETDPLIKEAADRISNQEDPVQFILDTHQSLHVGDIELAKALLVSIGVQSVLNSDGIQPKVSGDSGKGKTHCCKAMAHLVPPKWVFETSLSDKAIFYMKGLKEGCIVFCDDADLSDTLEGVIKRATSNFQTGTTYTTLDIKRREETKRIPARISWWLTSVDDDQSLQLLNRQFGGGVDESENQDQRVMEYQLQLAACGEVGLPLNDHVLICREIIHRIKTETHIVKIPFAKDITWRDTRNRRNLPIFLDIIKSYAVLRNRQRQKDADGALIADIQDFNDAKALYTGRAENQGLKLTELEMRLCIVLAGRGEATREEIAKALGKSVGRISHLIYGKDRNKDAGLLHKVGGFYVEKRTVENSAGHKTQKTYLKLDGFDALGMFDSVVSLAADVTHRYPTDTHTDTPINKYNIHTDTTDTNIERVQQTYTKTVRSNKSDSLRTRNSKQGISGISGSANSEKRGNSEGIVAGNSVPASSHGNDFKGNTPLGEQVFAWAALWEKMYKAPLNSSNITSAVMEYCQKKKVPPDKFGEITAIFKRYAKIPTEHHGIPCSVEVPL
jgi:primase-polymerase (primpol)-like protein